LVGTFTRGGVLGAGDAYTASQRITIPSSLADDDYQLLVVVDATNRVVEPVAEDNNTGVSSEFSITAFPLPDLVTTVVTVNNPGSAVSGGVLTVDYTITNNGTLSVSDSWTDSIYLSTNAVFDSSDVLLQTVNESLSLGIGEDYDRSVSVNLADGISGPYYIIVVPDSNNDVSEGDGEPAGPLGSAEFTVTSFPYADLTVTNVIGQDLLVGNPVELTVTWTVQNVGQGAGRTNQWFDSIILSRDSILGNSDDRELGRFSRSIGLGAGATYTRTEIVPVAAGTSGRFTLFVNTDVDDQVFEVGTATNSASPTSEVVIAPREYSDLFIDSVTTESEAGGLDTIAVNWTVSNVGIATTDKTSWSDRVYLADNPEGTTGRVLLGSFSRFGALPVGGSYDRTGLVQIPRTADGTKYIVVETSGPYEFLYDESGNRKVSAPIELTGLPPLDIDLEVTSVTSPTAAQDSRSIEVSWTVENVGVDPAEGSWIDYVYLSPVGSPGTRITLGSFSRIDALAPGQSYTRTELVQLPGVLGGYVVSVKTDNGRRIGETDESDESNVGSAAPITISAQPRPDLQVRQNPLVPTATSVTAGTVIDVSWIVENFGAVETPTGGSRWSDRVYLSLNDNILGGGDIALTPLGTSSTYVNNGSKLGVGETYTSTFAFELPRGAAGANAFIIVKTDDRNQVSEAPNNSLPGEQNNTLAIPISIDAIPVPPPDLVTSNVVAPVESFDDSPVVIRYRVTNQGVGVTIPNSWTDQIWLTRDVDRPNTARGDRLLKSVTHRGELEVGEFYENVVTVNLPAFTEGQFYITVFSDPYNRVFENQFATNLNPDAPNDIDGNNFKATPITVLLTPPADLQVTDVTADSVATGGEQVTVSWRVENRGTAPTDRERWADAIYISDDEFLDNGDTLVFALPHDGAIDVGEDYDETATFTLPPSASGSYFLVRTNLDPRVAITSEPSLLEEVEAVLKRVEAATGKPLLEVSLADLNQFTASELRAILAGPTNVLETVFEGPFTDNNVGAAASTITDAYIDLRVTSLAVDPGATFSGENVSVTYTVTNEGTEATHKSTLLWEDKIYVSSSPTFNVSTSKLATRVTYQTGGNPLQPGASYTRTVNVPMPIGGDDVFYVHVLTDLSVGRYGPSLSSPGEGSFPKWPEAYERTNWERRDKSNNISDGVPVDVTYREADLEISNLEVDSPVDSGGLTTVQFRVTNNGTRATREGIWNDVVYISTDPSLDPYDLPIASLRHSGVLSVGQFYDVNEQVLLPENINGTFYILVATDSVFTENYNQRNGYALPYPAATGWPRISQDSTMGRIAEFDDEVDNVAATPIEVNLAERPNLKVTQIDVPDRLETGQGIPISFDLSNIGGGDVPSRQLPFDVQVYLSRDNTLDPRSDRLLATVGYDSVIESGGVVTSDLTARMPSGITGPYYVITVIDPVRGNRPLGQVIESNESDNRSVSVDPILIELPPPTDLVIESVTFDKTTVGNNGVVTISYVVRNAGDTPATGIWDDAFYLSRDAIYTFDDRLITQTGLLSETPSRTLAPGATYSGSVTVSLPATLPGPYNVIGRVDVFDDIFEGPLRLNNDFASANQIEISTPQLLLDVPTSTSLDVGNTLVYSIDVPAGETLQITADSENASLEMYAAYERVPYSGDFDAAFEGALGGSQRALVPRTQGGRYYILIRGTARNPIELNATLLPLQITSVTPDRLGDASYATVEVRGADFDPLATLKLVRPQFDEHIPVDYLIVDATRIVAVFDLSEAELGLYDVVVTNPDGKAAIVPHRLLVEPASELDTDVGMGGPNLIGLGESGIYNVTAASLTNIDTPYVHWSINVPRIKNPDPALIPGEALRVTSNLGIDAGEDATGQSIDTLLNIDGIYAGGAFIFDLPAAAIASTSFQVEVYPELPALLEEDPNFLKDLLPGQIEQLSFDFFVHSSVTPMSAEDYIAYQTQIAIDARNRLLAFDPPLTDPPDYTEAFLQAIDNATTDEATWVTTYLTALAETGLLRAEDVPPQATTDRRLVGHLVSLYHSFETGAFANIFDAAQSNGSVTEQEALATSVVKLIRELAGETPDAYGGSDVPADSMFDLGSRLGTRQIAFEIRAGVPEEVFGVLEVDAPDFDRFFVGTGTSNETATLLGPTGFGEQNFLPSNTMLPFEITVD
ncbi:hypothetical protein N9N28_16795, partial [Rubripirellula amarantea]|nr:hypothetical protein [Rubripirellula amarantea]